MSGPSAVGGVPRIILRAEGAAVCLLAVLLYWRLGASWWLFAILFLTPDVSFLGYLGGPRAGAIAYNAAHTLAAPLLLAAAGLLLPAAQVIPLSLIWTAHIGFDRMLGYGLKYATGFGLIHLGRIGRNSIDRP
jgi:Domain of unknown function (DUF4260)